MDTTGGLHSQVGLRTTNYCNCRSMCSRISIVFGCVANPTVISYTTWHFGVVSPEVSDIVMPLLCRVFYPFHPTKPFPWTMMAWLAWPQMAPVARYEVAPTVVNFTRSLLVSFAQPLGELTESGLSNTKGAPRTKTAGSGGRLTSWSGSRVGI